MSLTDRLATPPAPKPGSSRLDVWVDGLPKKDRDAVLKAVLDPQWRHIDLQHVLEAEGAPKMADTSFGAWRRKRAER